jgi:hypothetical protein
MPAGMRTASGTAAGHLEAQWHCVARAANQQGLFGGRFDFGQPVTCYRSLPHLAACRMLH